MKRWSKPLCVSLAVSLVLVLLTAVLPIFPYTLQSEADLRTLQVGAPFSFVTQKPAGDALKALKERDYNHTFTLPRYDLYPSTFSVGRFLLSWLVTFAVLGALVFVCTMWGGVLKRYVKYLVIGALVAVLCLFLPAAPGTFRTVEDLDPMTFGFPLPCCEQTPDLGTVALEEGLETYLAQNFIAPDYAAYTVHLHYGLLFLSALLITLALALVFDVLPALVRKRRRVPRAKSE